MTTQLRAERANIEDAERALLDFLDANADSLTHALRIAADGDDTNATAVESEHRPHLAGVVSVLRESAKSRRALAARLDALMEAHYEATEAGR